MWPFDLITQAFANAAPEASRVALGLLLEGPPAVVIEEPEKTNGRNRKGVRA